MTDLQEKARTEYGITNADQMEDKQLKAEMKAIDEQAKSVDESGETPDNSEGETSLDDMTRKELNELAASEGVENPESYANKGELISAIEDNRV